MAKDKNNFSELKIKDGVPVLSFASPSDAPAQLSREDFVIPATSTSHQHQLEFAAYYDPAHRLIFVLDNTLDERTPNALLVINPDAQNPGRKWNDILTRDYGADIESIRPKEDNKYKKLDIEYDGLSVYNDVINAHSHCADIAGPLAALSVFRDSVAKRNAEERLNAAEKKIAAASRSVARARAAMAKIKSDERTLRDKLAQAKKSVGKGPTKESAARILRLESQLDANAEKLKRAERREKRAEARMLIANADADAARERLKLGELESKAVPPATAASVPLRRAAGDSAKLRQPAAPVAEIKIEPPVAKTAAGATQKKTEEPKVETMADENVKPLFDKDPDIMNDDFAFRPISFDMPSAQTPPPQPQPAFAPPEPARTPESVSGGEYIPNNVPPVTRPAPDYVQQPATPAYDQPLAAPVPPIVTPAQAPAPQPIYPTAPSRPLPPSGGGAGTVGSAPKPERRGPSAVYYLLLILLILLSIFTLWLYQRKTTTTTPNITTSAAQPAEQPAAAPPAENPFIAAEPTPPETQPSLLNNLTNAVGGGAQPAPEQPASDEYLYQPPYNQTVQEPTTNQLTEAQIMAAKPSYNVSGPAAGQPQNDTYNFPDNTAAAPTAEVAPPPAPQAPSQSQIAMGVYAPAAPAAMCDGNVPPDADGCCPGEVYTDIGGGDFNCCIGDNCFPPLTAGQPAAAAPQQAAPTQADNRLYYQGQYYEPDTYNEDTYVSEEYYNSEEGAQDGNSAASAAASASY